MLMVGNLYERIHQNLIDAGCDQQTTERCMAFVEKERLSDMVPILAKYRRAMLDTLHKDQKQIDCLDYLLYLIKRFDESVP